MFSSIHVLNIYCSIHSSLFCLCSLCSSQSSNTLYLTRFSTTTEVIVMKEDMSVIVLRYNQRAPVLSMMGVRPSELTFVNRNVNSNRI
jgi:hypothetical protein